MTMLSAGRQSQLETAVEHHLAGRKEAAAPIYEELLAEASEDFRVTHLLGVLRHQQGRSREAVELLEKARSLKPDSAPTLMCLGLALSSLGRRDAARESLLAALALAPKDPETWTNLGAVLAVEGRLDDAAGCLGKAIAIDPRYAPAWVGLGSALHALGRSGDAVPCCTRALEIDPSSPKARFVRGQALQALQRPEEGLADFEAHLKLAPDHHQARSFRLFLLNFRDDLTPEQLFADHRAYGEAVEATLPDARVLHRADAPRRLRLGFLSPDLRRHSVSHFLEPLLAHLDRKQFEVILYHDHYTVDDVSRRLRAGADLWRQLAGTADRVVEETVLSDAPDVLVDLAGHTGFNRLPIFARRLAPLQITYLGYPGTTGLKAMDCRFTDAVADPPGRADCLHTERLVRFSPTAWVYAPPADAPPVSPPPGLRGGPTTFGSFNTWAKVSDGTLRLWKRILEAVPSAHLAIKSSGLDHDRCRRRLEAAGLPLGRIRLLPTAGSVAEHLALYGEVDVALDTFPYNGTTTTCEALWMGAPVVALAGDRHAARVGASLLTTVGHPEWVAASEEDYVAIAARLAADLPGRSRVRTGLRDEMERSSLFDYRSQAERFGEAVLACWNARTADSRGRNDAPLANALRPVEALAS